MKKVICDRCGKEFVGRNPLDFYEHLFDNRVYVDLCSDCEKEYQNKITKMDNMYFVTRQQAIDKFMKGENNNECFNNYGYCS